MMKSYQAPFWLQYIKITISRNKFCNSFVSIYHRESQASLYISRVVNCIWHAKNSGGPKYYQRANNYLQGLWNMIYHYNWIRNEKWIALRTYVLLWFVYDIKILFWYGNSQVLRHLCGEKMYTLSFEVWCDHGLLLWIRGICIHVQILKCCKSISFFVAQGNMLCRKYFLKL